MAGSLTSIYQNVSYALNLNAEALMKLQEQAASGNEVNRASDNPSDAYRILTLNSQERSLANYEEQITNLIGNLEIVSTIIEDMAEALADTKTNLTQIVSGVNDEEGQARIAEWINSTLEQMISLANTKHAGQYLFGGSDTGTVPYTVERDNGMVTNVTYRGSSEARRIDVSPAVDVEGYWVGDEVFRVDDRGDPIFLGETGAAVGTGTSNVCGDVWLTVTHDGSNYQISIDDGATVVTVPPGGNANQAVTDSRTGKILYVDTTGLSGTGVELVRVPGTYDVFGTLMSLRDMLLNEKEIPGSQVLSYVNQCVAAVEEVRNGLMQADVTTGSRIGFLDTLKRNVANMQFDTQDETTGLQEADIAQIAIDLSRREVLYQMSLSVAGKLMTTTLLDFIG
ncbi:MAG: flagellar hook-associated protein FlgL [Sedimentisphaerales bacterium]|nr:flagellar hook-associated protein FlgL [Sedimentisphaerales bacterium]